MKYIAREISVSSRIASLHAIYSLLMPISFLVGCRIFSKDTITYVAPMFGNVLTFFMFLRALQMKFPAVVL